MIASILIRWLAALGLVLVTYNPTQLNFVRWALDDGQRSLPLVALVGVALLIAYVIYLRATFRSIGAVGIALVAALVGAFVWVLVDFGLVSLQSPGTATWVALVATSFVLGIGLSWSIVRRALSGQADIDDVDE